MRKLWMAVVAGGALTLAVNPAWAADSSMHGSSSSKSSQTQGSTMQGGQMQGSQMQGSMMDSSQMAKVQKIDKDKNMVTLQLPLAPSAQIKKDGQTATLDQLKEGDQVRASFDPSTSAITRLDVQSKDGSKSKSSDEQMNQGSSDQQQMNR